MNIDEFDFETPLDVVIVNPATGQPTDAVITVVSSHSRKAKEIIANDSRKKLMSAKTDEEKAALELISDPEYYAQAIVKWENVGNSEGDIECTPENIKEWFSKPQFAFVVSQLNMKCRMGGYNPKQLSDSQSGSGKKRGTKAQ